MLDDNHAAAWWGDHMDKLYFSLVKKGDSTPSNNYLF